MSKVFIVADNIISPLGFSTSENYLKLKQGSSGIAHHTRTSYSQQPFYASLLNDEQEEKLQQIDQERTYTKFERMLILSIANAIENMGLNCADPGIVFVISTTKGNISLLENANGDSSHDDRLALYTSAKLVARHFGNKNQPVVVSNACISGLSAMLTAKRLLESGQFTTAIVSGADVISKFILSGFQSFQAVSDRPCKPFDAKRNGVTLGEAAGTVILSVDPAASSGIQLVSGAISNDANHISGPSRTGEELCLAVTRAMQKAGIGANEVAFVSAHGTATVYNDEMEAKAFSLAGLNELPVNSLKGYFGHTLGAAGLVESIVSLQSLHENVMLPTQGFETTGVSAKINVSSKSQQCNGQAMLKTASGFGGCNAALVFQKSYS